MGKVSASNGKIRKEMSVVFVNGVFDVLSVAHFNLFLFASRLRGDDGMLFVALDSDEKVKKDKGSARPIFRFEERREAIEALDIGMIEDVFSFDTNEQLHDLVKQVKPDIILKSDQWKDNVVGSDVAKVVYFNTLENFSTSKIIERVLAKHDCHMAGVDRMLETIRNSK